MLLIIERNEKGVQTTIRATKIRHQTYNRAKIISSDSRGIFIANR
jgi:hypothetical protein